MDFVNKRVIRNRGTSSGPDDRTVHPEDLNFALLDIQSQLQPFPKNKMEDYHLPTPTTPVITSADDITECTEIREHLSFDKDVESNKKQVLVDMFNDKQRTSFDMIDKSVSEGTGECFYLDGAGGCGKTTVAKALLHSARSRGQIAIACASSGIAATLLPKGQTAHSAFKIPVSYTHLTLPTIYSV